jgi:hypothetical protein
MSEIYPSDEELNALISEAETGIEYIPTGTAPYYLHFRKLLYRLLLIAKRGNDLRLYDEGGLSVGIKAGKYWVGQSLVSFGGASGVTLTDDTASIYLYLDSAGSLVSSEYTGWPDMDVARHVRLAVVTTEGGDITSITDARDHHSISVPAAGGGQLVVEAHTASDQLTEDESGTIHTNAGASGSVTLTLPPSASAGTKFTFAVQSYWPLRIDPGAAAILDDCGTTAGKFKWADGVGENMTLVADANGNWMTVAKWGGWGQEA